MGNNNNFLQAKNELQDINEWLTEEDWKKVEHAFQPPQKKQRLSAKKRGQVRRDIEEIKEQRSLKEFLGEDYELLDS